MAHCLPQREAYISLHQLTLVLNSFGAILCGVPGGSYVETLERPMKKFSFVVRQHVC